MSETSSHATCSHNVVDCINPFEIVRKYRCRECRGIAMCACDEEYGRQFLPHQLSTGTELGTQQRVAVTLGFVERICNECRGLKPEPHPRAALHGATSKVRRYYWREIHMETTRRFSAWKCSSGPERNRAETEATRDRIEDEVVAAFQELHKRSPKYEYQEPSESVVLLENDIEVLSLRASQVKSDEKRAVLDFEGNSVSVEEFAMGYLRNKSYDVVFTESAPFHVLYGAFTWILIQDPADPLVRVVSFGSRTDADAKKKSAEQIWTLLPEDFGTPGYAMRRAGAIDAHFREMIEGSDLLWLFDYWLGPSAQFRQYLWAHRESDVARSRELLRILPQAALLRILRYLVGDYWRRHLGWPDLVAANDAEFFFAEVKFSKDKLSEAQRRWIVDNRSIMDLPFKLIKIHRTSPTE